MSGRTDILPFQEANQVSERQVQTSILELLLAFIFDLDAILAEEWKDAGGNTLTPVKNFSVTTPINYINSFGATAALKYIYRNEHLHTTANVFYNEGQGTFNFEVVPWEKKTADITFD